MTPTPSRLEELRAIAEAHKRFVWAPVPPAELIALLDSHQRRGEALEKAEKLIASYQESTKSRRTKARCRDFILTAHALKSLSKETV